MEDTAGVIKVVYFNALISKFPKLLAITTSAIPVLSEIFQLHAEFEPKYMVSPWCANHSAFNYDA